MVPSSRTVSSARWWPAECLGRGAHCVAHGDAQSNAQCDQTVGNSIDSYLKRHPDLHQELQARSEAEGGGPNVIDYLNRHPDVRQHLIDLSQQCVP